MSSRRLSSPHPPSLLPPRAPDDLLRWLERQCWMMEAWRDALTAEAADARLISAVEAHGRWLTIMCRDLRDRAGDR